MRPSLRILIILATALSALALAACGSDDDSSGVSGDDFAPTTEAPDDAVEGGSLDIISAGFFDYLDPGAAFYNYTYVFTNAAHRGLMGWQPGDERSPSPDLAAEDPEVSEDLRTVTFTLRDGVMFSPPVDREVTSADVKYAIERTLLPGVENAYTASYMDLIEGWDEAVKQVKADDTAAPDISGIETPDDKTIVFNLTEGVGEVLVQALTLPASAPVPEEYAREFDAESPSTYDTHQVTTGPYMIENNEEGETTGYTPGKELKLVRNPNWDPETDYRPAYLDEITFREGFTDVNSAFTRILEGESQVNGDILPTPAALKQAAQDYPDQLEVAPSGGNRYVALNTQLPPFDDINVRKAVLASADREAMRLARGGELVGPIATHFIPPGVPGFEEAGGLEGAGLDFMASPEGDPELAAEYMRKAGYESGKYEGDEEILMVAENAGIDKEVGEVVLQQFEDLGFEVEFRQVNSNIMYTKFCNVPEAEVAVCPNVGWIKDFNDPQAMLDPTFNGDNIEPTANSNWPQLDVPEINDAMNEAALIGDIDERAQVWGELDTQVMEQAPAIPYVWDDQGNVRSENVLGVINLSNGQWDIAYTSLAAAE
jgi:peptide/nickel transport system substrate-binding protein